MHSAIENTIIEISLIADSKNQKRILEIEIETGKSYWQSNIEKNIKNGLKEIVIIATNADAYRKISEELETNKEI